MEALIEVDSEVIDMNDINELEKQTLLVGRLVTEKHWNPSNLIDVITKAWKPKHGMSCEKWEEESKLVFFCFNDVMDREWVLKNQPWHFNESLFAIKKFTRGDEQSINVTSFWARLYDVPLSCMNERALGLFTKQIGILESVDVSGEDLVGKFVRFKVSINITKPLVRGITILVKGEQLWLPLMYESLPIYCFSCGTIGHVYSNCQSFNGILKYSNLKWSASSSKKRKRTEDTPVEIPCDIIENILSRLPVKDLLRFKLVCKQWKATISDPTFSEIHLQQYNNSSSRNLLAWEQSVSRSGHSVLHVAKLEPPYFNFVSTIQHSWKCPLRSGNILGSCDGLYLIRCFALHREVKMCVVWNPSCRAYREVWCPQQIGNEDTLYGIYYNPLMKDYKVVIGDKKHYAVFSCRYNTWSEVKETKDVFWSESLDTGVSVNGTLYWRVTKQGYPHGIGILCFDWKDEKFKKVAIPDDCNLYQFKLSSSGGHVCLWYNIRLDQIMIMKKLDDEGSWMEFKVKLQADLRPYNVMAGPNLLCWISEEEIILYYVDRTGTRFHIFYNLRKSTFASIYTQKLCRGFDYPHPVLKNTVTLRDNDPLPYVENLFLQ